MHLSSKELEDRTYANAVTAEDFERWEETFGGPGALVPGDERTAKAAGAVCITCGREWGAAELHPAMVGYSQWRADRALWSAAEPAALEGYQTAYQEFYPT